MKYVNLKGSFKVWIRGNTATDGFRALPTTRLLTALLQPQEVIAVNFHTSGLKPFIGLMQPLSLIQHNRECIFSETSHLSSASATAFLTKTPPALVVGQEQQTQAARYFWPQTRKCLLKMRWYLPVSLVLELCNWSSNLSNPYSCNRVSCTPG